MELDVPHLQAKAGDLCFQNHFTVSSFSVQRAQKRFNSTLRNVCDFSRAEGPQGEESEMFSLLIPLLLPVFHVLQIKIIYSGGLPQSCRLFNFVS